jgi:hypothetical protein
MSKKENNRMLISITTRKNIGEIKTILEAFFKTRKYKLVKYNGQLAFRYASFSSNIIYLMY